MLGLAGQLPVGELSLYLIAAFPILYVLIRLESHDVLGSEYLLSSGAPRVTVTALQIKQHWWNILNMAALVWTGIGLSPFLSTMVETLDVAYDSADYVLNLW